MSVPTPMPPSSTPFPDGGSNAVLTLLVSRLDALERRAETVEAAHRAEVRNMAEEHRAELAALRDLILDGQNKSAERIVALQQELALQLARKDIIMRIGTFVIMVLGSVPWAGQAFMQALQHAVSTGASSSPGTANPTP